MSTSILIVQYILRLNNKSILQPEFCLHAQGTYIRAEIAGSELKTCQLKCFTKLKYLIFTLKYIVFTLASNQNIVDGDMNKLHKKSNETHDKKSNARRLRNGDELLFVRLCAFFD